MTSGRPRMIYAYALLCTCTLVHMYTDFYARVCQCLRKRDKPSKESMCPFAPDVARLVGPLRK